MSRILRRPMFRGGSTNNGGIMSYAQPRKGYEKAGPVMDGFENEEEIGQNQTTTTSPMSYQRSDFIDGPQMRKESSNIQQQNKTYKAFGQNVEEGSIGDVMLKEYLGNRPDPMGKFLINFGLNYMSARPRGGKFGAITTAAEAAKKPTEQLFADQDTDTAMEIKLLSAFGKEKDTDLTRMIKAYARSKNISEEAAEEIISKQKFESPTGFLKDYSDTALIRKFGEDWGKSSRVDNATQRNNYGKFRLKYE